MTAATQPTNAIAGDDVQRWCTTVLALLLAAYVVYFGAFTWLMHYCFQTYAYDLGTFDQGIWLAGHSTDPFVTVRGLHLLGDHVRLFAYVLAPLYWVWDDAHALLLLQTVFIASGAVFVHLLGRRELPGHPVVVLALCAGYLFNPAVQNLNLDHAHPDAFASTLLLASIYFLRTRRTVAFTAAAALAMSCKEDVPLVYVMLGLVLAATGRRRFGLTLAAVSATYVLLCTQVILPHFNQVGFFRADQGYFEQMNKHLTSSRWYLARLTSKAVRGYLWSLGLPVAFLGLLSPATLLPALPALAANVFSDVGYMRTVVYHYATSIVPFVYAATVDTLRRVLPRSPRPRASAAVAAVLLLGGAVGANLVYGRVSLAELSRLGGLWRSYRNDAELHAIHDLLARIPADAAVSADYSLVPHLAHRRRIYMFPNPFHAWYWGIKNRGPHDSGQTEYIIGRPRILHDDGMKRIGEMVDDGEFELIGGNRSTALLYRRASSRALDENASCGDWNGDGAVTPLDARMILAAIMGGDKCPPFVCDVDGDGTLTAQDAMLAKRRAAAKDVPLRCPPRAASSAAGSD